MYIFFEKGRSGISYISNKQSKANNKYLNLLTQDKNQNIYTQTNNLYGYVMSRFLPKSGFKWIDPEEFDLNKYTSNSSKGCDLEVDLRYPNELQITMIILQHHIKQKREMLPEYQLKISDLCNIPISNVKKISA